MDFIITERGPTRAGRRTGSGPGPARPNRRLAGGADGRRLGGPGRGPGPTTRIIGRDRGACCRGDSDRLQRKGCALPFTTRQRGQGRATYCGLLRLIAAYCASLRRSIATRPRGHGPAGVGPQGPPWTSARRSRVRGKEGRCARALARERNVRRWVSGSAGPGRARPGRAGPGRDRRGIGAPPPPPLQTRID